MRIQIIVNQSSILLSRTRSCADPQTRRSKKMDPKRSNRRVQIDSSQLPKYDIAEDDPTETLNRNDDEDEIGGNGMRVRTSNRNVTENQDPFMGVKVRRKASLRREYQGDYIDVPSHPNLMKILQRQGDKQVLFADKLLKCTGTGKIKQRILLITDVAVYILDPETDTLKRRIALVAVEKMCLSELTDNFFAIIIPTEYDLLMASPRKTEIVTVLSEVTKTSSNYELEIVFSNSFQYNAAAEMVKEVQFEEVEGGVKTRFVMK